MSEQVPDVSPVVVIEQKPTNGLGLAGFIVSLVSFVSCGLLAPVALILSIIGMFKKPKGFAVAGLIVSSFQLLLILLIGLGPILALVGIGMAEKGKQEEAFKVDRVEILNDVREIETTEEYYQMQTDYSFIGDAEYKKLMKEAQERVSTNNIPDINIPELIESN